MSLIAWYKLEDLSDSSGNNNDLTLQNSTSDLVSAAGKIGNCYRRQTYNSTDWFASTNNVVLPGDFTMACWALVRECNVGTANGLVTNHDHTTNLGAGINVYAPSSTEFRISCNTGTGTGRTYQTYYGTSNIKDKWSHLVLRFIKATNNLSLWVNGVQEFEMTYAMATTSNKIGIFHWSLPYTGASYKPRGYIDDVRIYDHALSNKEIATLSKALCLWYKFDDFAEPTTNIATDVALGFGDGNRWETISTYPTGLPIEVDKVWRRKDPNTYWGSFTTFIPTSPTPYNRTFTVSFWYYLEDGYDGNVNSYFYGAPNSGDSVYNSIGTSLNNTFSTSIKGQWLYGQQTIKITTNAYSYNYFQGWSGGTIADGKHCYIAGFQLEEKDHATPYAFGSRTGTVLDTSGYENHATLIETNTPRWTESSKVGAGAYDFNGVSQSILLPITPTAEFSFSFWFYKSEWGSKGYETLIGGPGGFELESKVGTTNSPVLELYSWGAGTTSYELSKWNHVVFTRNASATQLYLNGELKLTGTAGSIPAGNYFIGAWNTVIQQNYKGIIDDFRMYATVLSETDIKELYASRASLDENGKFTTYKIEESINYLDPELFSSYCEDTTSPAYQLYDGHNVWVAYPASYYPGYALNGLFKSNTQYKFHVTYKHDTYYNGNYVTGGFGVTYTDGTTDNIITTGGTGWNTQEFITDAGKTIQMIGIHYYTNYPIYIDVNSYLVEYLPNTINDNGTAHFIELSECGITDGLFGWWPLNGDVLDITEYQNDGVINGATVSKGMNQLCYNFDGNDEIQFNIPITFFNNTAQFSISLWVKLNSFASDVGFIAFATQNPTNARIYIGKRYTATKWSFAIGSYAWDVGSVEVNSDWTHLTMTVDKTNATATLYINGGSPYIKTGWIWTDIQDKPRLGSLNGNYYFNGLIQDVRIYNRALSAQEVKVLYNVTGPTTMMSISDIGTLYTKYVNEI